jgi:phosphotransferase system enzyme I (PtsI)
MNRLGKLDRVSGKPDAAPEIRLKARAVSRGVAVGRAVCVYGTGRQFYRIDLESAAVPAELRRFRTAVATAKKQLCRLAGRKTGVSAGSGPSIFEAHLVLIEDPALQSGIERQIAEQQINAEWAIKLVTDEYVSRYKAIEDEHLRDRSIDLEDVSDRVLAALGVSTDLKLPFGNESIVAAQDLKPSTVVEFAGDGPRGFITENGGWTSHSFILAREMKRPAVTGVRKLLRRIKTGDVVIVDGYNGEVILNPSQAVLEAYGTARPAPEAETAHSTAASQTAGTLDGRRIRIFANADEPAAYLRARAFGAEGVGLFRSEFLFSRYRRFPTEEEQFQAYVQMAETAGEGGVKVRTFDIGSDRSLDPGSVREPNPALGLRGVRLSLSQTRPLRTQLRALLRASHERRIDIILPLVSGVSEIRAVKEMLNREVRYLRSKDKAVGKPKLGVMIEVPSAVLMIDEIAAETDFLCLGTNDLIQYLLAVDRDNEAVSTWYRTLHPAVIRAINKVLKAAARAGKEAIVCGEMAGSPYYVPLLIGLGATSLSMNPTSIPRVKTVIAGIAAEEGERLAARVGETGTIEEAEAVVDKQIRENWLHLFPRDFSFR